ncbi:hypothetical protein D3C81_808700 [compost metagenome]
MNVTNRTEFIKSIQELIETPAAYQDIYLCIGETVPGFEAKQITIFESRDYDNLIPYIESMYDETLHHVHRPGVYIHACETANQYADFE